MSKVSVNRLTNANIWVDGNNYLGKAEEITLPMVKPTMSDQPTLGLQGKLELPTGIDKMEGKIKWNSLYKDAQAKFSDFYTPINLQVRSSLESWEGGGRTAQAPVVIFLKVTSKGAATPSFKQHENAELESDMNIIYMKQVVDGVEILEIDVLANIYKVNGVDLLAQYRSNLGA